MEKKNTRLGTDPLSWIRDSRQQDVTTVEKKKTIHDKKKDIPKTKEGLKEGWIRATFIVREEYLEKIKAISYWDRKDIKQVVDEALTAYLKNKKVKPKPVNQET
ncbi:MAG: hypothetical protein NC825_04885 [Candidatus Omnitrophica bacterium]|jgi:hypothetical protein|nr:hypothetical protein [Candidatus Omnitrophota bacterium]